MSRVRTGLRLASPCFVLLAAFLVVSPTVDASSVLNTSPPFVGAKVLRHVSNVTAGCGIVIITPAHPKFNLTAGAALAKVAIGFTTCGSVATRVAYYGELGVSGVRFNSSAGGSHNVSCHWLGAYRVYLMVRSPTSLNASMNGSALVRFSCDVVDLHTGFVTSKVRQMTNLSLWNGTSIWGMSAFNISLTQKSVRLSSSDHYELVSYVSFGFDVRAQAWVPANYGATVYLDMIPTYPHPGAGAYLTGLSVT